MKNLIIAIILIFAGLNTVQSQTMTSTRYGDSNRMYHAVQGTQAYGGSYTPSDGVDYIEVRSEGRTSVSIIKNGSQITVGTTSYTIVGGGDLEFDTQYATATGHGIFSEGNRNNPVTYVTTTYPLYSFATNISRTFRPIPNSGGEGQFRTGEFDAENAAATLARQNRGTTYNVYEGDITKIRVNNWSFFQLDNVRATGHSETFTLPRFSFSGSDLQIRRIVRSNALSTTSPWYDADPNLIQIWLQDPDVTSGTPYSEIYTDLTDGLFSQVNFRWDERSGRTNCDDCYSLQLNDTSIQLAEYTTTGSRPERVEAIILTLNTSQWNRDNVGDFMIDTVLPITENVWGSGTPWIQNWGIINLDRRR